MGGGGEQKFAKGNQTKGQKGQTGTGGRVYWGAKSELGGGKGLHQRNTVRENRTFGLWARSRQCISPLKRGTLVEKTRNGGERGEGGGG